MEFSFIVSLIFEYFKHTCSMNNVSLDTQSLTLSLINSILPILTVICPSSDYLKECLDQITTGWRIVLAHISGR